MKNHKLLLIALLFFLIGINYSFIDSALVRAFEEEYEVGIVERVVDGDTIVVNGSKVRMLGINSPEKGEIDYDEARDFLVQEIEGQEVKLKFGTEKFDRYQRKLTYVFLGSKNMNLESVKLGYSGFYFPSGKDKYYSLFYNAWQECLENEVGICQSSEEKCVYIDWRPKEDLVLLKNICSYRANLTGWSVKDEGRKKFIFSEKILGQGQDIRLSSDDWGEDYVWTKVSDSIFVRDSLGKLVFWDTY